MWPTIHELRDQPVARDGRGVVQGEVWKVRWKVMNPAKSEDIFNALGCDFDDCSMWFFHIPFISYQYHSFLENSELRQIGIFL